MRKADEVLNTVMDTFTFSGDQEYFEIFSTWSLILGEDFADIAAHSEPVDMKGKALILYVDHSGWIQRIEFKKKVLLKKINMHYPNIHNIFIQKVSNEKFMERRNARQLGNTK